MFLSDLSDYIFAFSSKTRCDLVALINMAFMSKQMGLSPTGYYNKRILELKGTLGPVPMPKATRQNIIGFCRRMEPPSRQQTIPWCTTGKVIQSTSIFKNILHFCMQLKVKYIHTYK